MAWHDLFVPTVPLLTLVLRGSLVYLGIVFLLRAALKREAGMLTLPDVLMTVLIADAASPAMTADYRSVTEGFVVVGTIVFWNFALDWLAYRIPWVRRTLHPGPLLLIRDGAMVPRNMRRELITEEDLWSALRREGVDDLAQVRRAYMESNGHVSVIKQGGN
ncbi:MAG TPA: YetF domain-containing protein [Gemmatimonadales bacterium]|nr:YetF domain-containing protein [Gemmatimonadales bacterium]